MTDQTSNDNTLDMSEHTRAYDIFVRGSIGLTILSVHALILLAAVAFGQFLPLTIGFLGFLIGVAILIANVRSNSWISSLVWILIFGLVTIFIVT